MLHEKPVVDPKHRKLGLLLAAPLRSGTAGSPIFLQGADLHEANRNMRETAR